MINLITTLHAGSGMQGKKQLWLLPILRACCRGNVHTWAHSRARARWEESQLVLTAVSMMYVMNHKPSLTNELWNINASTLASDIHMKRYPSMFFPKSVLSDATDSIHEGNNVLADLKIITLLRTLIKSNGYKEECCVKDQVLHCINTSLPSLFMDF